MAEYTANAVQTVAVGQNVLFTDVPVSGCCQGIIHREGSGIVTLRSRNGRGCCGGGNGQGFTRYKVSFGANVAIPAGGTANTALSLAIAIGGEPIPTSSMIVTPTALSQFWNVYASIYITVPVGCCYNIAVENTGTTTIDVQNANLIVEGGQ